MLRATPLTAVNRQSYPAGLMVAHRRPRNRPSLRRLSAVSEGERIARSSRSRPQASGGTPDRDPHVAPDARRWSAELTPLSGVSDGDPVRCAIFAPRIVWAVQRIDWSDGPDVGSNASAPIRDRHDWIAGRSLKMVTVRFRLAPPAVGRLRLWRNRPHVALTGIVPAACLL